MKKILFPVLLMLLFGVPILAPVSAPEVIAQDAETPQASHWWNEATWYLMFVRSFQDSDGDGIGDFQGMIDRLDYLNDGDPATDDDLGITAIWLLPITEAVSYHGYDTTDYNAIDSDYGTMDDFHQFLDEAHQRGIKVVVDFVANHTSDEHPWFEASAAGDEAFRDWYIWEDENPNTRGPWGEPAWYFNTERDAYYYAPFWSKMPDLNHENPAVVEEIYESARFWIEDVGVDGFRLDAVKYWIETEVDGRLILEDAPVNREYLAEFTQYVHSLNPDAMTVGEVYDSTAVVQRYTNDDSTDMLFEFSTAEAMMSAARTGSKNNIERQLGNNLYTYDEFDEIATFLSNHDQPRVLTQLEGDIGMNKVAASLLMTLPGTPFIYYGEEIGMTGTKPDERIRRPMQWNAETNGGFTSGTPWQPLAEDSAERTVAGQTNDPDSLLSHYRSLIHLRNRTPALHIGDTLELDSDYRSVFGYVRYTGDDTLLIVHNLDDRDSREYSFELDESAFSGFDSAELIFSAGHTGESPDIALPLFNDEGGFEAYTPLEAPLPPFSVYVIRLS